jgi:CheY-like chemotaxis protein
MKDALSGLTVLVVDDDLDTLVLFEHVLRNRGAEVITTQSARAAVLLYRQHRPRVVVSDIAMPDEDGYWLMKELAPESARVIAVTGHGDTHPPQRTRAAGFQAHLRKPVEPDALCDLVAQVGGRP